MPYGTERTERMHDRKSARTEASEAPRSETVLGTVLSVDVPGRKFELQCRSGDRLWIHVGGDTEEDGGTTYFDVLSNLDEVSREGVLPPGAAGLDDRIKRHVSAGALIAVEGLRAGGDVYARRVHALAFEPELRVKRSERLTYLFEEAHWWLTQISRMADEWLEDLFNENRDYRVTDFARFYRTNLNITGSPAGKDPDLQECATLSRLIYGLSSTYLLTGSERYLLAAKAAVEYQRQTFRSLSHDGEKCVWAFGRRRIVTGAASGEAMLVGSEIIIPSENPDDRGTIPLYEQIYAIAGLAQYYRITLDWQVLEDIRRTLNAFEAFYRDANPEYGGYFSHIHPATMCPDTPALGPNMSKKNWNSIGDHIPAYLVNLLLAIDPVPNGRGNIQEIEEMRDRCIRMLEETSQLILDKFPDADPTIPYVNERFLRNWTPDHQWGWQRNRAVVGHNLKIAWNLTRCHNYFVWKAREYERAAEADGARAKAKEYGQRAARALEYAERLAQAMAKVGLDLVHGGVYDTVEREPRNGLPVEFAWSTTKDFWQQEQGILAYLILQGATRDPEARKLYRDLYRELAAFWNLYFLDHDNRGIFFRVTDQGLPFIQGTYGQKAGHAVAGYHAYELNYLAHIYIRAHVETANPESNFCLHFRPERTCGQLSINVLPDFFEPGDLQITSVRINGTKRTNFSADNFQIPLAPEELGSDVTVEFRVP